MDKLKPSSSSIDVVNKLFPSPNIHLSYLYFDFDRNILYWFHEDGNIMKGPLLPLDEDCFPVSYHTSLGEVPLEILLTSEYIEWRAFAKERL